MLEKDDKKDKVLAAIAVVSAATNHYELLAASGIELRDNNITQWAKKAQRVLTLLLHPDTCSKLSLGRESEQAATDALQEMQAACDVLSDESQRMQYDANLSKQIKEVEEEVHGD